MNKSEMGQFKKRMAKAGVPSLYRKLKLSQFGLSGRILNQELLGDGLTNKNIVITGKHSREMGCSLIRLYCALSSKNNYHVLSVHGVKGIKDILQGTMSVPHYWANREAHLTSVIRHNKILFIPSFVAGREMNVLGNDDQRMFIENYIYERVADGNYTTILGSFESKKWLENSDFFTGEFKEMIVSEFRDISANDFTKDDNN